MVKHFVAIAPKGKEFIYKRSSMIAVPESSGIKIMELLNKARYEIKDGEVWHLYDNDWVSNDYISREIKMVRKGLVRIYSFYDNAI